MYRNRRTPAVVIAVLMLTITAHAAIWPFSSTKWQWSAVGVQFGQHRVGQPYAPQFVTLSNTGSTILTVTLEDVSAPFGAQGPMPGFQLVPGKTYDFNVEFYPPGAGSYSGVLRIQVNKKIETITLTGSGV